MEHDAAAQQMEQLSRDFAACGKGFYTKLDLGIVVDKAVIIEYIDIGRTG